MGKDIKEHTAHAIITEGLFEIATKIVANSVNIALCTAFTQCELNCGVIQYLTPFAKDLTMKTLNYSMNKANELSPVIYTEVSNLVSNINNAKLYKANKLFKSKIKEHKIDELDELSNDEWICYDYTSVVDASTQIYEADLMDYIGSNEYKPI